MEVSNNKRKGSFEEIPGRENSALGITVNADEINIAAGVAFTNAQAHFSNQNYLDMYNSAKLGLDLHPTDYNVQEKLHGAIVMALAYLPVRDQQEMIYHAHSFSALNLLKNARQ